MNQAVTAYIQSLKQPWQIEICNQLRSTIQASTPDIEELMLWSKPHYKKNGQFLCNFAGAKEWINLTIFNGTAIDAPDDFFEPGVPERKTIKIKEGQTVDYGQLVTFLRQAVASL